MTQKNGFFSFKTYKHGLRAYNNAEDAVVGAKKASKEIREQVIVYLPFGERHVTVGSHRPTHIERLHAIKAKSAEAVS